MKKLLYPLLFVCCAFVCAHASNSISLNGEVYALDTLFHNVVGPGTTQTSLWLHNDEHRLRVFYTTIDMTNPNTGSPVISRVSYSSHGSQSLDVELLNVPCTFNSSDEKVFNASEEASTMKINNILYKGFDGKSFSTFVPGESSWAEITIMFDK